MDSPLAMLRNRPRPARIYTERLDEAPQVTLPRAGSMRESRSDGQMRHSALKGRLDDTHLDDRRGNFLSVNYTPMAQRQQMRHQSGIPKDIPSGIPSDIPGNIRGGIPSPPSTPPTRCDPDGLAHLYSASPDQTRIILPDDAEFDLDGCDMLGSGLWSEVYRVQAGQYQARPPSTPFDSLMLTPPATPQKPCMSSSGVFAVKSASRPDSRVVFEEEAQTLQYLQLSPSASSFVVPFHGLANAGSALVFHCADTTLDAFASSLSESSSLTSLLDVFPSIATQLVKGLAFLHSVRLVHADIKPANILLDLGAAEPVARYADFSASQMSEVLPTTVPATPTDTTFATPAASAPVSRANSQRKTTPMGGGTWTFMAPEQLNSNPLINEPSYASDVYSLGVTLLVLLLGGKSPFRQVEDQNVFLLREAIKMGNPMSFARNDTLLRKHVKALEAEEVGRDALRLIGLALRKNKADRVVAAEWC